MYKIVVLLACGVAIGEGGVSFEPSFGVRLSYPSSSRQVVFIPAVTNYQQEVPPAPYSIPYQDYFYLQHQKADAKHLHNSQYCDLHHLNHNGIYQNNNLNIPLLTNYNQNFNVLKRHTDIHHQSNNGIYLSDNTNVPIFTNYNQNLDVLKNNADIHHQSINGIYQSDNLNIPLLSNNNQNLDVLKNSAENHFVNSYSGPAIIVPETPEVTKNVYFHVPPPDMEEQPVQRVVVPPPKKKYNIIFVKVPSQEPNYGAIQQLLQSQNSVEDKTLIYVLSKSREPQPQVILPLEPPKVSSPEVYYVKYKVNSEDGTKINNELEGTNILENISPALEPRVDNNKS